MSDYVARVIEEWADVRPDLDTDPVAVVLRVLRAAQLLQARLDAVVATEVSLSHKGDLDTLTALRRAGGSSSPSELAAALQLTSGGMTNRLDRLEAGGLLQRERAAIDGRGIVVVLTEEGARVADVMFVANLEAQRRLVAGLKASERDSLAALLEKLLVDLGDEGSPRERADG